MIGVLINRASPAGGKRLFIDGSHADLTKTGGNAVSIHLPFHYSRVSAGHFNGALALTFELIRNAETVRLAVMRLRQLLEVIRGHGANRFGLIATSYGGWIGSILLSLEEDFEFAALLQPFADIENTIWENPAALTIRSRLRRHLIQPGVTRQHAHLASPLEASPLIDIDRVYWSQVNMTKSSRWRGWNGGRTLGISSTWKSLPTAISAMSR